MSYEMSLFSPQGERKYLNKLERRRFHKVARRLADDREMLFCVVLLLTGCRVSEALDLRVRQIDSGEAALVFKTLKQREKLKYRFVPVPRKLIREMTSLVQSLELSVDDRIWDFSRSTAWRIITECMEKADITGVKATPRGLRHTFATQCIDNKVDQEDVQFYLGHSNADNTKIYIGFVGKRRRSSLAKTWDL